MAMGVNAFWEERISSVRTAFGSTGSDDVAFDGLTLGRNDCQQSPHRVARPRSSPHGRLPSAILIRAPRVHCRLRTSGHGLATVDDGAIEGSLPSKSSPNRPEPDDSRPSSFGARASA